MIGIEAPLAPPKLVVPWFWLTSGARSSLMKPRAFTWGVTFGMIPMSLYWNLLSTWNVLPSAG